MKQIIIVIFCIIFCSSCGKIKLKPYTEKQQQTYTTIEKLNHIDTTLQVSLYDKNYVAITKDSLVIYEGIITSNNTKVLENLQLGELILIVLLLILFTFIGTLLIFD